MNELLMELVEDALSNMDHIEMCMEKYHGVLKKRMISSTARALEF